MVKKQYCLILKRQFYIEFDWTTRQQKFVSIFFWIYTFGLNSNLEFFFQGIRCQSGLINQNVSVPLMLFCQTSWSTSFVERSHFRCWRNHHFALTRHSPASLYPFPLHSLLFSLFCSPFYCSLIFQCIFKCTRDSLSSLYLHLVSTELRLVEHKKRTPLAFLLCENQAGPMSTFHLRYLIRTR